MHAGGWFGFMASNDEKPKVTWALEGIYAGLYQTQFKRLLQE